MKRCFVKTQCYVKTVAKKLSVLRKVCRAFALRADRESHKFFNTTSELKAKITKNKANNCNAKLCKSTLNKNSCNC